MKKLIEKIEKKNNALEIIKAKIKFPQIYSASQCEVELQELEEEILALKNQAIEEKSIESRKELIYGQLTEYIQKIEKPQIYPFSKSQGLSFKMFYILPLINVKNIIFYNQNGLEGAILNLTLDEKDSVINKEQFLEFLKNKRDEALDLENLFDLYLFYKTFANSIREYASYSVYSITNLTDYNKNINYENCNFRLGFINLEARRFKL